MFASSADAAAYVRATPGAWGYVDPADSEGLQVGLVPLLSARDRHPRGPGGRARRADAHDRRTVGAATLIDAMVAPPTEHEILDVNRRYHDVAADSYDAKWGISFGEIGHQQVLGKLTKLLGPGPGPFERSLEIGSGTGYFSLNLLQTGVVRAATCTDISPGMLADARTQRRRARPRGRDRGLRRRRAAVRGRELRPRARPRRAAPPARPRPRASPSSSACCGPAALLFFAGEPSRHGDRIAAYPKRAAIKAAPLWRKVLRARPAPTHHGAPDEDEHALEAVVDVHAFVPTDLQRHATEAGFADVRVRGEELLANWFGWFNRTLEATADPKDIRARAGSSTPTAATSCSSAWTARCSSRACRRGSSTT